MNPRKIAQLSGLLMVAPLLAFGATASSASAATGACSDYKPDNTSVLLCNLGLKPKPEAPTTPATGACSDYPDQTSVFLCNLGLKAKPPVSSPTPTPEPEPTPEPVEEPPSEPTTGGVDTACGATLYKADGTPWICTFHDGFNGTSLDRTYWTTGGGFITGTTSDWACYRDEPDLISQSGGTLKLSVRKDATARPCLAAKNATTKYRAGSISTYGNWSQQYGRFEARIKTQTANTSGLHEAFWLWPDVREANANTQNWPSSGEIDIAETYSSHPHLVIPFLHYSADVGGPQPGVNTAWDCPSTRGEWHTYALEWDANSLKIFVDGNLCLTNTSKDSAFNKKYIVILTQALGSASNPFNSNTPLPATMEVDYVKIWK